MNEIPEDVNVNMQMLMDRALCKRGESSLSLQTNPWKWIKQRGGPDWEESLVGVMINDCAVKTTSMNENTFNI